MNGFQRKIVLKAQDSEDLLTEWEADFISSLADRDEKAPDAKLSDRQNEILNRISQKLIDR